MRLVTITALAVLIATPALAAGGKKKLHRHHSSHHQSYAQQRDMQRGDPYVVRSYSGRRVVGRDPDPNIRQRLRDDDAFFRNEN